MTIVLSFVGLSLLLVVGHVLRMRVRLLQKLYLPSCVIGGLLGLAIIQTTNAFGHPLASDWTAGWNTLPGFLINIVFACLFLGVAIPRFRTLISRAGPQLAYGQTVAWGQYVVGIGVFLLVIQRFWDLPAMFGAIIPIGFEGGHGTAGGMGEVFEDLDWAAGKDYALASATAGIISAIVVGMALINWATRCGHTVRRKSPEGISEDDSKGVIPVDRRPSAGKLTVSSDAIESLTLHLGIVAIAILIGVGLKQGMLWIDGRVQNETFHKVADSFPLFPLCMLGGLIVQLFEDHVDKHKLIDLGLMRRIQNTALDYLVVAAIAMIRIEVITAGLVPLLILIAVGIGWNVFCVLVLARRVLPDAWFERSIAEMGQSMGVTATGLLLLRVVDPDYETPAADAFASKQLLHEPFMGGGLWTSAAVPLLYVWGGPRVLLLSGMAVIVWIAVLFGLRATWKRPTDP